jgi:hypothetical protein
MSIVALYFVVLSSEKSTDMAPKGPSVLIESAVE